MIIYRLDKGQVFFEKKTKEKRQKKRERVAAACDIDEERTMTSWVVAVFQTSRLKIKFSPQKKLGFYFPNVFLHMWEYKE